MVGETLELGWDERPREEAALFNPAFCGEIIALSVSSHHKAARRPLSFPLAFTILPLALHPASRAGLPVQASTTFRTWAVNNDALLTPLADRIAHLRGVTREALLFMIQLRALDITQEGLTPGETPIVLTRKLETETIETSDIKRSARLLGRWFAAQSSPLLILQALGLKP
ncbi:three component ABC system middle component [Novosphingobium sp. BL-52-GroH]|uniref:three component ABC system middle component n=1 Tax=Novosphingobium sp. BL-52-GroH TaxID=3349877 RepID=UPI00384C32E7